MINKSWLILLIFLPIMVSAKEYPNRVWAEKTDKTVEAKYVSNSVDSVVLENTDGKQLKVSKSKLSTQDKEYIKSITPKVTGELDKSYKIKKAGKHYWILIKYSLTTEEKRIKRPTVRIYRYIEDDSNKRRLYGLTRGSKKSPASDKALFNAKVFRTYKHRTVAYPEGKTLLLLRIELWYDGVLLDHIDTSTASALKLYNLNNEWWVN